VPIEEQLLPNKALQRFYGKVSWLYVCRTFKKDQEKDREALRTHDRFGISSWPQMFLFDPRTDRVLGEPPRDLKGFTATFDRVLARWKKPAPDKKSIARHLEARTQSLKFEKVLRKRGGKKIAKADKAAALKCLLDEKMDIVARIRALRLLRATVPGELKEHASGFLKEGNDPWRYEALALIEEHPDPVHGPALLDLLTGIGAKYPSRNPNVLRSRTVACLGGSGGAGAVDPLLSLLQGPLNNYLTRLTPSVLAALGRRVGQQRGRIGKALVAALPPPVTDAKSKAEKFQVRMATAMAQAIAAAVAQLSGAKAPKVPRAWTAADRRALEARLRRLLGRR